MNKNFIFTTSGLGNAIFQICYRAEVEKECGHAQIVNYLENPTFLGLIKGWSYHRNIVKYDPVHSAPARILDKLALIAVAGLRLFIRKDIIFRVGRSTWHFGYFQGRKLGVAHAKLVENSTPVDLTLPSSRDVILHVRRGDFAESDMLNLGYYIDAIRKIKEYVNFEQVILIGIGSLDLSNDLQKKFNQISFIHYSESEELDFQKIWNARVVISSNSTFCFWASVFGNAEVVTYPMDCTYYQLLEPDLADKKRYVSIKYES